ncbi:MAG: hypothetical protein KGZ63_05615, partial [Clostridiales bacterium]|nr:hypothetical protein [Clostridiales bacterium]
WTTVDLKLNSSKVAHSVDPVTGTVYYDAVLPSRSHKVDLSVRDGKGNLSTRSWTFIADKEPPAIIFLPDFSAGMTITDGQLRFSATLKDLITIKSNAQLRLNGELLDATFTYKGFYDYDGNWIISDRTEAAVEYDGAVENGEHTLTLYVEDNLGNNTTYSWAFTAATPVNNPPYVTGRSPAANAVVNISNPVITLSVKDDEDNLSQQSVRAKLNGQSVPATFQYKGRWVTDYDGDTFYVVDSYQEGTVTVETSGLSDGIINVEISITDAAGNTLVDTWPFTVSVPPEISEVYPADKSESTGVDKVYAVITSNGTIDWASVVFRINNSAVSFTVDEAAGTVTHARSFTDGSYNVYLEVKDTAGNACTRTWSFISDTSPPALTYLHDFTENMVITDAVLKVRIFLTDLVDIKNNAVLLLNGTPLAAQFSYPGYTDSYTGEYIITKKTEAYLDYEGAVMNDSYTLSLFAEDKLGNQKTWNWTFIGASPPVIAGETPILYGVSTMTPTVSAFVKGQGAAVNWESIVLTLNGTTVLHEDDTATGRIWYTPTQPLANESYHTVVLSVSDETNLKTTRTWRFYTNTFPDMYDANINFCIICHKVSPSSDLRDLYVDVHAKELYFGGDHLNNNCDNCHDYITVNAGCGQCHGQTYSDEDYPHGSRMRLYDPKNFNVYFPLRVMRNREMFDCVICHQPGAGTLRRLGAPLNHHDIPELHKAVDNSCAPCHALSLTREHARDGRTDKNGDPVNCDTCHRSADVRVVTAVRDGKKACYECHDASATSDAHVGLHEIAMDPTCANCHGSNLATETWFHGKEENGCGICHESQDPNVKAAVRWQKRSCFDCHNKPHDVYMTVVPEDIPVYSGVPWGTPQDALIWSDDGWLPPELNNSMAKILFSSRAELNNAAVYSYYTNAFAAGGWIVLQDTYNPGEPYFMLFAKKGRRYCAVWLYGGAVPGTAGPKARIQTAYH